MVELRQEEEVAAAVKWTVGGEMVELVQEEAKAVVELKAEARWSS